MSAVKYRSFDVNETLPSSTQKVINILTNMFIGAVAFNAIYFAIEIEAYSEEKSLPHHIYFCVIGYVIITISALLAVNPHGGMTRMFEYNESNITLLVLQIIGSILPIAGSMRLIVFSNFKFETAHGICGLITLILTLLSLIGGIANLVSTKLSNNSSIIKSAHSCSLFLTILFALITLGLGFDGLYRMYINDVSANLSIGVTAFALIGVILLARPGILRFFCK